VNQIFIYTVTLQFFKQCCYFIYTMQYNNFYSPSSKTIVIYTIIRTIIIYNASNNLYCVMYYLNYIINYSCCVYNIYCVANYLNSASNKRKCLKQLYLSRWSNYLQQLTYMGSTPAVDELMLHNTISKMKSTNHHTDNG